LRNPEPVLGIYRGGVIAGEHQVALDAARIGFRPARSRLDHGVGVAQGCRRVSESPERDLRLRGEAEDQRLEGTGANIVEPVASKRHVVEGAEMIALRHP